MTGHYSCRVAPFGYPWVYAYLQLAMAYRSLSRPSSFRNAQASAVCPYSLDLRLTTKRYFRFILICFGESLTHSAIHLGHLFRPACVVKSSTQLSTMRPVCLLGSAQNLLQAKRLRFAIASPGKIHSVLSAILLQQMTSVKMTFVISQIFVVSSVQFSVNNWREWLYLRLASLLQKRPPSKQLCYDFGCLFLAPSYASNLSHSLQVFPLCEIP